jgi:hypothetical protein
MYGAEWGGVGWASPGNSCHHRDSDVDAGRLIIPKRVVGIFIDIKSFHNEKLP